MQLYQAEVRLGGSMTNTVIKKELSAAEVIVLRNIHGAESVMAIKATGSEGREYDKEYQRLCNIYGVRKVQQCFPGAQPELPDKLKDVGITKSGMQETKARGPNNQNPAKVKEAKARQKNELADLGIDEGDEEEESDAA